MKAILTTFFFVSLVACGTWIFVTNRAEETARVRLAAQKKQAAANEARAQALKAQEEKAAAALKKEEAEKTRLAKEADREAAEANRAARAAEEKAAIENRKKAEAEAKAAEANRKAAAAQENAAKAKAEAARLAAECAAATNEIRQAELERAREERARAAVELETKKTALAHEELKKADYEALLRSVREVEAVLKAREEETRPDRTLQDLLADNEVEAAPAFVTPEEVAERLAAESNRVSKIARYRQPKTPNDLKVEASTARLAQAEEEGRQVVARKARARLVALARQALKEGRAEAAERYLAEADRLYPETDAAAEPSTGDR